MKKILILGHQGMLGNAIVKYFNKKNKYVVQTINCRFGQNDFEKQIIQNNPDYIINCIGVIPQKKPSDSEYQEVNINLPRYLEKIGVPVIHPSTDCEFSGGIPFGEKYTKKSPRDAKDIYGKSKADISKEIENSFVNTKIIRTSIIGHELHSSVALLDWFLTQNSTTKGYVDHQWSGITTLEWAKLAENIIDSWENFPVLNQFATEPVSKFELLKIIARVYNKEIEILPHKTGILVNKCLTTDCRVPTIDSQLFDLKTFYEVV